MRIYTLLEPKREVSGRAATPTSDLAAPRPRTERKMKARNTHLSTRTLEKPTSAEAEVDLIHRRLEIDLHLYHRRVDNTGHYAHQDALCLTE